MNQDQTVQNQSDNQVKTDSVPIQSQAGPGLGEKEREGIGSKELIQETGREIEPSKEVKEAGVKLKKEEIKLPPPVEKMGVRPSGPAVTLLPQPTVALPLTDDQVMKGLAKPSVSSWRWLAEFCLRQLKKLHIGLKKIHGKVVRVRS